MRQPRLVGETCKLVDVDGGWRWTCLLCGAHAPAHERVFTEYQSAVDNAAVHVCEPGSIPDSLDPDFYEPEVQCSTCRYFAAKEMMASECRRRAPDARRGTHPLKHPEDWCGEWAPDRETEMTAQAVASRGPWPVEWFYDRGRKIVRGA